VRGTDGGTAMTADTVMWIASMTKAVTSVAAMQLVEQGRLSLDAPLGDLLPELAHRPVLEGFDAAGEPILRRPPGRSRCASCSPTPPASATTSGARI